MAKHEGAVPQSAAQDEAQKILDQGAGEARTKKKPDLAPAPSLELLGKEFQSKAEALMQRFESIVARLKGTKEDEQGKLLLAEAQAAQKQFLAKLEALKEQRQGVAKRVAAEVKVKSLHRQYNAASGDNKKRGELRPQIEKAEQELGQAPAAQVQEVNFDETKEKVRQIEEQMEKFGGEFQSGVFVRWKSKDGKELEGEVIGPAHKLDEVIVKTEQVPSGFAISKKKLEKISLTPEAAVELITQAKDFDGLIEAVKQCGIIKGRDGKIYHATTLVTTIEAIRSVMPEEGSFAMNLLTQSCGLRAKVVELLRPIRLEKRRGEFARRDADMTRRFGGVTGWLRRIMNTKGYIDATENRNAAYENYERARAEAVFGRIDGMLDEQVALVDARAVEFQKTKGWGSKLLDFYRENPTMQKFKKYRALIGVGVLGAGLSGVPLAAALGGGYVAWRLVGAPMGAFGSYDLMTMSAEKHGTNVALSSQRKAELSRFAKEKGLGRWSRFFNKEVTVDGKKQRAGAVFQQKRLELQAQEAETMPDKDLDNVIAYFESTLAIDGKKPSENPLYQVLMREKRNRYRGALEARQDDAVDRTAGRRKGEYIDRYQRLVGERTEHLRELHVMLVINYFKQKYFSATTLFEKMKAVSGTPEQRKKSQEYKAWEDGKKKLQELYGGLPLEVQTLIDKYEAAGGSRQKFAELFDHETHEQIMTQKGQTVEASALWKAEWKLRPELAAELNEVLAKNLTINKQAEEQVEKEMDEFIQSVDEREHWERQRVAAVEGALSDIALEVDAKMKKTDEERLVQGWTAIRQKRVRQGLAAALGLAIGGSALYSWLTAGAESAEQSVPKAGTESATDHPVAPEEKPVAPKAAPVEPKEETAATKGYFENAKERFAEMKGKVGGALRESLKSPVGAGAIAEGLPELPDKMGGTIEGSQGIHHIMDPILEKNAAEMFPDVPKGELAHYVHDWKIEQLRNLGFAFQQGADGEWHYGYPLTVHEGAEINIVKDASDPSGWRLDVGSEHVTHHHDLRWPTLPVAPDIDAPETGAAEPGLDFREVRIITSDDLTAHAAKLNENAARIHELKAQLGEAAQSAGNEPIVPESGASSETFPVASQQEMSEFEEMQKQALQDQQEYIKDLQQALADKEKAIPSIEPLPDSELESAGQAPDHDAAAEPDAGKPHADVRAGGSIEERTDGNVTTRDVRSYYEGVISGVGTRELVESGILKENWSEYMHKGGNVALMRDMIENEARHLYAMQQALENAKEAGDTESARAIAENLKTTVRLAERRLGDVFKL